MIFNDECLIKLRTVKPNYFDAMATDPPAGIAFMNKSWDKNKGGRDPWIKWLAEILRECHRVMKPGAHGFVWALPRTSHWTATALENAGFEIRDIVTHLFGSGFPKSLNISKAIDKAAGAEREVIASDDPRSKFDGSKRKTSNHESYIKGGITKKESVDITAPSTKAAKQWDGYGTALKPASEHWILIRKPLSEKTVAKNVLRWGVGGINIDACRIEAEASLAKNWDRKTISDIRGNNYCNAKPGALENKYTAPQGRFPANLILDDVAGEMLDKQSLAGGMHSAGKKRDAIRKCLPTGNIINKHAGDGHCVGDSGGASRFFYCAKPSKKERGEGNNHPTVKSQKLMSYLCRMITPPNGIVLDPFMGSGSTGVACKEEGFEFYGIEQQHDYYKIAKKRIEQWAI